MGETGEKVLVVIPTYNERENIGALLDELVSRYPALRIAVVDSASPDGTGEIVAARAVGDSRIHLIQQDRKLGIGAAYRAGFAYGLEKQFAFLLSMDADFSHAPACTR